MNMFSAKNNVKSILFHGSTDIAKSLLFEVAIHWAEEGCRVFYITAAPFTSIPAIYHDRNKPLPIAFNMIKFIYLSNYEKLVEQLVDLPTHTVLPSILLIDNLHTYIKDAQIKEQDVHIAKLCATLHYSINACSRLKKTKLYMCASVNSENFNQNVYQLYFNNIWNIDSKNEDGVTTIELNHILDSGDNKTYPTLTYKQFEDGTLILNQIFERNDDN